MQAIEREAPSPEFTSAQLSPTSESYRRLFRTYADKGAILDRVQAAFFTGIEMFGGRECREKCERSGLAAMHLHFPAESVGLLEAYVNHQVRRRMLEWSAAIGRHDVGFEHDFLVEDLLVVRVHYPHAHIGQPAASGRKPRLLHRIRYGLASNIERVREAYDSNSALRLPFQMFKYARARRKRAALPLPYRCHAPHLDSWLGQPTTSLSVWLAIAGVDEKNSMCLYPETVGVPLPVSGSQFLDAGVCLPKPTRPEIKDGELFVFRTDILHSSQLNVSDRTRVALTTRIDPGRPIFSADSLWFVQRWYSANGILAGRWRHQTVRASEHCVARPPAEPVSGRSVRVPAVFRGNELFEVGKSETVPENEKLAVEFKNTRVLIVRSGGRLRAFSARCPHDGYRMDDGYHDDCALYCPGHGREFDIRTGTSALKRYRLAMFNVCEKDGTIFVGAGPERVIAESSIGESEDRPI
jgi:nitrite reductase/ring-hydroxylating ferredoxin subunit